MERKRTTPAAKRGYHRKKAQGRSRAVGFLILAVAIAVLWFMLDSIITLGVGQDRFYNVYVNGVRMKGYTKQQGYALFETLEAGWRERAFELYSGENTWQFTPAMIGAELNEEETLERAWNFGHVGNLFSRKADVKSLKDEPRQFVSAISYDERAMDDFLHSIRQTTDRPAVDAEVVLGTDRPHVLTESSNGRELDVEATLQALNHLMLAGTDGERVELPVETIYPSVSSDDISGGLDLIVTYTTKVSGTSNRKHNIAKSLSRFNAVEIKPGMELGFNEVVGTRSQANGYKKAIEFSEGTTTEDYGGGVCQASTTLYGAILQSGMTVVRRSPHSMTVGYVWPSLDAAVTNTGSKDLVFRNDTDGSFYIYTQVTDSSATINIYGRRPPYRYGFEYRMIEDNIPGTSEVVRVDTTGEFATYTDEKVLASEGKTGRRSEGWLISYDWTTGEEVARELISSDNYKPGVTIYYTGTQVREAASAAPTPW